MARNERVRHGNSGWGRGDGSRWEDESFFHEREGEATSSTGFNLVSSFRGNNLEVAMAGKDGGSRGVFTGKEEKNLRKEPSKESGGKKGAELLNSGVIDVSMSSGGMKNKEVTDEAEGEDVLMEENGTHSAGLEESRDTKSKNGAIMKVCTKCAQRGHVLADCSCEVYCDICDSSDHVNHKCPVLKLPKPVVQAVGFAVDGLGFHHIPHHPLPKNRKGTKKALVRVVGGELSKERLIALLHKVCLAKWNWEPVDHGEGSFVVLFPSKGELQRAINFGGADVKEGGVSTRIRVEFEEWFEEEEGFLLPKIWVRVFGVRKKLREYLPLWAVGSLLGATQMVDMKTTRKNDFWRIFIAVLNPNLVPKMLDVVMGDHYFELKFKVEKKGVDENGEEVEFNFEDGDGEDDGNLEGKEDEKKDEEKERDPKRTKSDDMAIDDSNIGSNEKEERSNKMGGEKPTDGELFEMAEQILDIAAGRMLAETYVHLEREEKVEEREAGLQGKINQLANITKVMVTARRASERLACNNGRHSLEKAESHKAWNLDHNSGTKFKNSFLSFSQDLIVENLNNL
uniref:CCHC-type domain-containing protein n=1 Tax=Oryza brachyantha TaxID=4533 RepID=J3MK80_ORYBR